VRIKITQDELYKYLVDEPVDFPKYTTPILNLANYFSKGTSPRVVGQMTDLIQEFPGNTVDEWREWYKQRYPDTAEDATDKVFAMIENFKSAIMQIDKDMVRKWVDDLMIVKTFVGLRFQEVILKKLAEIRGYPYRLAQPYEEAKGIDGFVGDKAISIKPHTYKSMQSLAENITADIIYYEKGKNHIVIEFDD
jgi:hypothetical protein